MNLTKIEGLEDLNIGNSSKFNPENNSANYVNVIQKEKIPQYEVYHQPTKADKVETAVILTSK